MAARINDRAGEGPMFIARGVGTTSLPADDEPDRSRISDLDDLFGDDDAAAGGRRGGGAEDEGALERLAEIL